MPIGKTVKAEMDEWEVRSAVDTLKRAEEIQNDPKMMKAVKAEVTKQKKALDTVDKKVSKKAPAKKAPVKKTTRKKK